MQAQNEKNIHRQLLTKSVNQYYNGSMKITDLNLGENLKRLRKQRGFRQRELAQKSGFTQASISRIERGAQTNVQLENLVALCNALDCCMFDLLTDKKVSQLLTSLRQYLSQHGD